MAAKNKYKYLNVNLGDNSVNEDIPTRLIFESSINDLDTKISEIRSDNFSVGDLKQSVRDYDKESGWLPCDGSSISMADYPELIYKLNDNINYNYTKLFDLTSSGDFSNSNINMADYHHYIPFSATMQTDINKSKAIAVIQYKNTLTNVGGMFYCYKKQNENKWTLSDNLIPTFEYASKERTIENIVNFSKLKYVNGTWLFNTYGKISGVDSETNPYVSIMYYNRSNSVEDIKNNYMYFCLGNDDYILKHFSGVSIPGYQTEHGIKNYLVMPQTLTIDDNDNLLFFGYLGATIYDVDPSSGSSTEFTSRVYKTTCFGKVKFDTLLKDVSETNPSTGTIYPIYDDQNNTYMSLPSNTSEFVKYKNCFYLLTYKRNGTSPYNTYNIAYYNENTNKANVLKQSSNNSLVGLMNNKSIGSITLFADNEKLFCIIGDYYKAPSSYVNYRIYYTESDSLSDDSSWISLVEETNLSATKTIFDVQYIDGIYYIISNIGTEENWVTYRIRNYEDFGDRTKWVLDSKINLVNSEKYFSNFNITENKDIYLSNNTSMRKELNAVSYTNEKSNLGDTLYTTNLNKITNKLPNIPDTSYGVKTYIKAK